MILKGEAHGVKHRKLRYRNLGRIRGSKKKDTDNRKREIRVRKSAKD